MGLPGDDNNNSPSKECTEWRSTGGVGEDPGTAGRNGGGDLVGDQIQWKIKGCHATNGSDRKSLRVRRNAGRPWRILIIHRRTSDPRRFFSGQYKGLYTPIHFESKASAMVLPVSNVIMSAIFLSSILQLSRDTVQYFLPLIGQQ